jgi:dephospho-CoA kinase
MRIIGITGTLGAGKGTVVDYLCNHYGFAHYSVRAYLSERLKQEGKEVNRDSMVELANRLRAESGPDFMAAELYRLASASGSDSVIESIRTPGEVELLRGLGNFFLLAVDADQELRYSRIVSRQSETDRIDFETFKRDEAREMESTDPNKQNLKACILQADFLLHNNGSFTDLYQQIENVFSQIKRS